MTTIIWDGNKLIADSMQTNICGKTGKETQETGVLKIKEMNGLTTYKGEKIEVTAFSGETRLTRAFGLANFVAKEVTDEEFFSEAEQFKYSGCVLLITKTLAVKVTVTNGVVVFVENARNTLVAMGSGSYYAQKFGERIPSELLMADAMKNDKWTGGTMSVWKDGELTLGVKAPKHFIFIRMMLAIIKNS